MALTPEITLAKVVPGATVPDRKVMEDPRSKPRGGGTARLIVVLMALAVAGVPLVAYLWETLNALLSGHLNGRRLLTSVPVLALFMILLALMARTLGRLDESARAPRNRR